MPTIEIVCLGQKQPSDFSWLPFAVRAKNTVVSHRGPLWNYPATLQGCIYHLGNPEMKDPTYAGFFASELVDWGCGEGTLCFRGEVEPFVREMMSQLLCDSPEGRIFFASDIQSGPPEMQYEHPLTFDQFWQQHEEEEIRFCALYLLRV